MINYFKEVFNMFKLFGSALCVIVILLLILFIIFLPVNLMTGIKGNESEWQWLLLYLVYPFALPILDRIYTKIKER